MRRIWVIASVGLRYTCLGEIVSRSPKVVNPLAKISFDSYEKSYRNRVRAASTIFSAIGSPGLNPKGHFRRCRQIGYPHYYERSHFRNGNPFTRPATSRRVVR